MLVGTPTAPPLPIWLPANKKVAECMGPCHPCGRPSQMEFQALVPVLAIPRVNQKMEGFFLPVSSSLSL